MVSQKFKRLLCEIYDYKCELCRKVYKPEELQIHRIRRGNVGGKYEPRNCQVLCVSHHKLIHSNEFK